MRITLLYMLLLLPLLSIGQAIKEFEPYAINLSVEDGLPSNEVYDLLEDKFGRFWFCTDNGLSVFDGQQFKRVTDTSYSVIILGGEKDKTGDVWFFTLDSEILKLKDGADRPELIISSDQTREYLGDNIISFIRFIEDDLILSTGLEILIISNYETKPQFEYRRAEASKITCICEGQTCISFGKTDSDQSIDIELIRGADTTYIRDIPGFDRSGKYWTSANISNGRLIIHSVKNLLSIDLEDHTYSSIGALPRNTVNLSIEDSLIWIGSYNDGIRAFSNDASLTLEKHLFKDRSFSKMKRDANGGMWLCSQESGIFYMPFPKLSTLKVEENESINISEMRSLNDECFVGQYRGKVSVIRRRKDQFFHEELAQMKGQVRNIVSDSLPGGVFIIELDEYLHYTKHAEGSSWKIKAFETEEDFKRFRLADKRKNKIILRPQLYGHRSFTKGIEGADMNRIRVSRSFGDQLFFGGFYNAYSWDTINKELNEIKINSNPIDFRAACRLNKDTFLIGTKGDGIIMMKGHKVIKSFDFKDERLNTIQDFEPLDHSVWIACPDALFEFNWKKNTLTDWTSIFLRKWMSFQGIETLGKDLLVASQNGYFIFDPDDIQLKNTAPEIYALDIVKLNGDVSTIDKELQLHESEASFQLIPQSVSFINLFQHEYRYRLANRDTNWIISQGNRIPFSALSPGEYELEIEAGDGLGNWSNNTRVLNLHISPFFYKSFWFYAISLILLGILGVFVYQWRMKQVKSRNALELQVSEARNEALSAQLNPHFIFNSLNSINSYLAQNDNRSAMRYLGKFAKMMRNTFENSQHSYISLQEELEAVQRYAEVESLRLTNEFELKLHVNPEIDTRSVRVPSLILQPIVENCIWHGIAPMKDQNGEIKISVEKPEKGQMKIVVSDNGIGLQATSAKDRLDTKRKSSSAILDERFRILSRLNKAEHYIEMQANAGGRGVSVTLVFSIKPKVNTQ